MSDWHLESLPEDVRAEAEKTAQRAGVPLHRWLGRVIRDSSIAEGFEPPVEVIRAKGFDSARAILAAANANSASVSGTLPPPPLPSAEAPPLVLIPTAKPQVLASIPMPPSWPMRDAAVESAAPPQLRSPSPATDTSSPPPEEARPEPVPSTPRAFRTARPLPPVATAVPEEERRSALTELAQALARGELSPVAEARAYLRLMTAQRIALPDLSTATGKSRDEVVRAMRLLGLPDGVRDLIESGKISRSQAFALLDTADPETAAAVMAKDRAGAQAP